MFTIMNYISLLVFERSSLSSLYGSWIYNYLCHQCISLLKLRVWIEVYSIQHNVIKFGCELRQFDEASKFSGPLVKVYNIFNTVIVLSHLSCHNALYFLNNSSVIFLTQLHSISEYCRILNTPSHLCLY